MSAISNVIRAAIFVCATTKPYELSLEEHTCNFLNARGYNIDLVKMSNLIEKRYQGARLYANYRNNLERVNRIGLIREAYRYVWLYELIANSYQKLTPNQLLVRINEKFNAEKQTDEGLDNKNYSLFYLLENEFNTGEKLAECGKELSGFASECTAALKRMTEALLKVQSLRYTVGIYGNGVTGAGNVGEVSSRPTSVKEEAPTPAKEENTAPAREEDPRVMALRDNVTILKGKVHDLEVKLEHARKDSIREIIGTLTGSGCNAPLSELYRISKAEDTPDAIRGAINNLFTALESENLKVIGNVGTEVTLTENNQADFSPYKNEELYLGETAVVFYPGYRYGREIMVRPIVRRIKKDGN